MRIKNLSLALLASALLAAAACSTTSGSTSGGNRSYTNIYDYLRGIPGIQVTGTQILIRGVGSINSGTAPLILVDGIDMPDISNVVPSDVVSVEVIKDSAAALYGFRAANGVIKITTTASANKKQ